MNITYYIGGKKLDLFEGESIEYRGKLVDADNIEAIFNDFINTFSVPSTPNNDKIFKDWYEIGVHNGFNPNKRVKSYIEFNTLPFREGNTQLEEIREKNGLVDSYNITFYSELTSLGDLFGEDTLKDLDLDKYNFNYNKANINALLTSPTLVLTEDGLSTVPSLIMPPIVVRDKEVQYNTGIIEDKRDISLEEGKLFLEDLRPALRQYRIIEAIEEKYGITFSRDFFDSTDFINLYTWLNGEKDFDKLLNWEDLPVSTIPDNPYIDTNFVDNTFTLNITAEELRSIQPTNSTPTKVMFNIKFQHRFPSDKDFQIRLIRSNGDVVLTSDLISGGGVTGNFDNEPYQVDFSLINNTNDFINEEFKLQIKSKDNIFQADGNNFRVGYKILAKKETSQTTQVLFNRFINDPFIEVGTVESVFNYKTVFGISDNLPDIKIIDYLKNLIKQFKLIIKAEDINTFNIININDYYKEGNSQDITNFVDLESVDTSVFKNNKTIQYKYAVEEDLENQQNFKGDTGRFRGNALKTFLDVDNKKDTTIEIDFNLPFFARLRDSGNQESSNINIALYQSVDGSEVNGEFPEDMTHFFYNGITPVSSSDSYPPVLLELARRPEDGESQTSSNILEVQGFPICDTSNSHVLSQVSNDLDFSNTVFNEDGVLVESGTINSWHNVSIVNNIYNVNHKPWLDNLLNSDARLVNLTSNLTTNEINKLDINNSIIYKNNRYSIEEYTIDLTTNETEFILFPNFSNKYLINNTTLSTNNLTFTSGGGFASINITTNEQLNNISTNRDYINIGDVTARDRVITIPVYVDENFLSERDGVIDIEIGNQTYTVQVNQAERLLAVGGGASVSVSPTTINTDYLADDVTVNVTANGFWKVVNEEGLEVDNDLGYENGTVIFSIPQNDTGVQRTFEPEITNIFNSSINTITIIQETLPFIDVVPDSINLDGDSQSFSIDVLTNLDPSFSSIPSYVTYDGFTTITNGRRYNFTITENPSTTEDRDFNISFFDGGLSDNVEITQFNSTPFINVTPTSSNSGFRGEDVTFNVSSNTSWTLSSDRVWINLDKTSGVGNEKFMATIDENLNSGRSGSVGFSGDGIVGSVSITQDEFVQPAPTQTGRPTTSVRYEREVGIMDVSWFPSQSEFGSIANYEIERSVQLGLFNLYDTIDGDLNSYSDTNTEGGTSYRYRITAIDNLGNRSTVSLSSVPLTVNERVIIEPTSEIVSNDSGNGSFELYTNCDWTITDNVDWVSLNSNDISGTGNQTINFTYQANLDNNRNARITTTADDNSSVLTDFTLGQLKFTPTLSLSLNNISADTGLNIYNVDVTSNTSWVVGSRPSWINISNGSNTGNGSFSIGLNENNTGVDRSFTLDVVANVGSTTNTITETINIFQEGISSQLTINPTIKTIEAGTQTYDINVTSNTAWNVTNNTSFASINTSSGFNNDTIRVSVGNNVTGQNRIGTIVFTTTDGEVSSTHSLTQLEEDESLTSHFVSTGFNDTGACANIPSETLWSDSVNFTNTSRLYRNQEGTIPAIAGFYSKNSFWLEVNASGFVIDSDICSFFPGGGGGEIID